MKITDIKGYYLSSPYGDGKVFGQPKGVKSIGIVEVHTNTGLVGYGETYAGVYAPELIEPIVEFLKPLFIDEKIEMMLKFRLLLNKARIPFIGSSGIVKSVISAIEIALFDVYGKLYNCPVYELLRGMSSQEVPDQLSVYASGGSIAFTPDQIKQDIQSALKLGHTAYKMRIEKISDTVDKLVIAQKELNTNKLIIDAIQGTLNNWDEAGAIYMLDRLYKYNPVWVEEPIHPEKLYDLTDKLKFPHVTLAMGEHCTSEFEFMSLIRNKHIKIIQPDVTQCGFILANKIILNSDITAMHVWGSAISIFSNFHMGLARNVDWFEVPLVQLDLTKDLLGDRLKIKNGYATIDEIEQPGLGIEITDKIKEKYKGIPGSGYKI